MSEVTLMEVLSAREARVERQQRLLQCGNPLICLNLNIAGPVKRSVLIDQAFAVAEERVESALRSLHYLVSVKESVHENTGCEAVWSVAADPMAIKKLCMQLEDMDELGRLFDLDVIKLDGLKVDRIGTERPCLVCGSAGRGCASRRLHSVPELQEKTRTIILDHLKQQQADEVASQAVRALLDEVCATPKPGLVDRADNGSHTDMDIFTFTASAAALSPYFRDSFLLGCETAGLEPDAVFTRLQALGLHAEQLMYTATGGINTHKGAIFTLGLLCCSLGRLFEPGSCTTVAICLQTAAAFAGNEYASHIEAVRSGKVTTNGDAACRTCGIGGARGEAANGFPALTLTALPALEAAEAAGLSLNDACCYTLLQLIANTHDTNMITRGGAKAAAEASAAVRSVLSASPRDAVAAASKLNEDFIAQHLSPGGCADLLSAALFLRRILER